MALEIATWGLLKIPLVPGTVVLRYQVNHNYGAAAVDWTLSDVESEGSFIVVTNASGNVNAFLAKAYPGKLFVVLNTSGHILTFKVTGQSGSTIQSTKHALFLGGLTDVIKVFEQA